MLSLGLALLAAVCNAVSSVAQRKANRDEAQRQPFGARLLITLLTRPAWLLGAAAMFASFLLQATALSVGTLSAVEPVLVLELPLTLMLAAVVLRHHLHRRDWVATGTMAAGLALLIAVLAPRGGHAEEVSTAMATLALGVTVAGVFTLALGGRFGPTRSRAAFFGAAAGGGFGLTASLIKLAVAQLSADGFVGLITAWATYATAVAGLSSIALEQAALNAGTLVAAQPGVTLLDPLVSVLWGTVVIGEHTRSGPILLLPAAGAALIVVAVVALARTTAQADQGARR